MNNWSRTSAWRRLAAVAMVAVLVPSCGGGSKSPATSTPVTTLAVATLPPTGGSASSTCSLGKGDPNAECSQVSGTGKLQLYIETAIDLLVREKPQLVDLTSEERPNAGTYRIKDVEGYLDTMVNNIRRQGACAERDADSRGFQRILVKDSNDISEGFALVSDRGFIERGPDARVQYCDPASFPVDRGSDVPPAGSGCGKPYPPPISTWASKIHVYGPGYLTLDSTPLVGPDVVYCMNAGFTDGRAWCSVRQRLTPRSARRARRGGSARRKTPGGRVPPGRSAPSTARARRAVAKTIRRTSTELWVWENGCTGCATSMASAARSRSRADAPFASSTRRAARPRA